MESDDTVISRCRLVQLQLYIQGFSSNSKLRTIARHYRNRARRIWSESEKNQFKALEKTYHFGSKSLETPVEPEDFDLQKTMSTEQLRAAIQMTDYGFSQMTVLNKRM